jgi:hypothetical protein
MKALSLSITLAALTLIALIPVVLVIWNGVAAVRFALAS